MALNRIFNAVTGYVVDIPKRGGEVMYSKRMVSASDGTWTGTMPDASLVYSALPIATDDIISGVAVSGDQITVTFKKIKPALGLTLGTLLSASIFEASPGAVMFHLVGTTQI